MTTLKDYPEICFFMIVSPRDAVIADYAIRSYRKLSGLDFLLVVYANSLTIEQQAFYFPRWKVLPYVNLKVSALSAENFTETDIKEGALWGPCELCDAIWDRELRLLKGKFIATVDADFEILNSRFVYQILKRMRSDDRVICFSSDARTEPSIQFCSYSEEKIRLNIRNHTWFCMYRGEAFSISKVSHWYFEEYVDGSAYGVPHKLRNAWDSAGMFQKHLRDLGYDLLSLDEEFRRDYIHYGSFGNNISITQKNVRVYRLLKLLQRKRIYQTSRRFIKRFSVVDFSRYIRSIDVERTRYHKSTDVNW